ncbi:hypothetical protein MFMK1_000936 [Metallumcola ferriviriculae]|uniref:Uncharacterized protein n=1 Tax=Metallumcola ferriviriculae TaxID=3039180 RepID=A0AAU0ULR2_9FIRM|nr:hypothetical protein MFMK1_000936 [Desulfitibacteraceae bacterium MK1]
MKGWKLWVVVALWIVLGLVGTFINNYHVGSSHGEPEAGHGGVAVEESH